ncbi:NAD(P)-binding protein [Lentinula guzmanii]|uniref:NAD(P)-binding protein n=1 Tax=Lentinula guzmanii TaxID=2804957 RepID=A0AA38JJY0_9AGAR|nr:NAD(P)-binding protein [Lentinula guzmanii]
MANAIFYAIGICAFVLLFTAGYISLNDAALTRIPLRVLSLPPVRWRKAEFEAVTEKMKECPPSIEEHLPPKTSRKYIVVGGSGFLGGWIIIHLLKRGESPSNIRIIDLRPPTRLDFTSGPAKEVQFKAADISKAEQVDAAFKAPWPAASSANAEITVFHTAAIIRFYERHRSLLPLSKVNVLGTENIIKAARATGASILIYTSSGSVAQRNTRLLLIPWLEKEPEHFVQVLGDQEPNKLPQTLDGFTCCYSHSKLEAEVLIRAIDGSSSGPNEDKVLRTGCIRPANGIYGPGADLWEYFLNKKKNITFFPNLITSNIYVENCSLAHLCYEQRLIEMATQSESMGRLIPDIGGNAFTVTDPQQPVLWSDLYAALSRFTDGSCQYSIISPTLLILVSFVVERYYITRHRLCSSIPVVARLAKYLPQLRGDLLALQPSVMVLSYAHILVDDSRARLSPSEGGLGYDAPWTALEGLYKTIKQFETEGSLRPISLNTGFGHGK